MRPLNPKEIASILAVPGKMGPVIRAGTRSPESELLPLRVTQVAWGLAVIVVERRTKKWRRFLPEDGTVRLDAEPGLYSRCG